MGLIRAGIAATLILIGGVCLYAQDTGILTGVSLERETQNIERVLSLMDISTDQRYEALTRLARLRQLSGDFEGAAKNWLEAAAIKTAATPEADNDALIAGVCCLFAMGEWDQAESVLWPLLYSGRQGQVMLYVHYLVACARLWKSGEATALIWLANHDEYAVLRPTIYYTLWKALGAETGVEWKERLIDEFPGSPEGRMVSADVNVISAVSSPMWLLLPEYGGYVAAAPAPVVVSPPSVPVPSGTHVLQTGLFSLEINARAQTEKLAKAGFSASLFRRNLSGAERWVVIVSPGPDINRTIRELKNAGFDSFPVSAQ